MDTEEVWRVIPTYEGYYEVSNTGNVRSLDRMVINTRAGSKRLHKGAFKKKRKSNSGYLFVGLQVYDKNINQFVHRLVAMAFIPNPENYPVVNHIDGDKTNNRVENLEWCTPRENYQHAVNIKLNQNYGTNCHNAKLDEIKVRMIREQFSLGANMTSISKNFNVTSTTIRKVVKNISWGHVR